MQTLLICIKESHGFWYLLRTNPLRGQPSQQSYVQRHNIYTILHLLLRVSVIVLMRNVPHRLMCLNTWSLVGGVIWGSMRSLGGKALLEEEHHWGGGTMKFIAWPHYLFSLCAYCVWIKCALSASWLPGKPHILVAMPPYYYGFYLSRTVKPKQNLSSMICFFFLNQDSLNSSRIVTDRPR